MTQMKLITNSRDEWTVKELVETLHAKVDDLERKLDAQLKLNDSIQWHLHAIVLHLTGDRAALTAFVMGSEPTVVPNEDEAMPVVEPTIVQDEPSPRKKPTFWSKMCPIAKAHSKTVQSARKMQKQLKAKLETKLSPSERAAYETRLIAEQQVESKHKSFYNTRIAELGYVHPNKAKRAAAKATN